LIVAAHPVRKGGQTIGAILVSNDSQHILAGQRQTLIDVLLATLLLFLLVVISLLLFGSRLAFRIERLKTQASSLIDDSGRFIGNIALSDCRYSDELGELSRSFSVLLSKLDSYTGFLETVPRMLRHEILNPVNTISMSLQSMTKSDVAGADSQQSITAANNALKQLQLIVSSLTEAANIDEGLKQDDVSSIDMAALLKEYVSNSQRRHSDYHLNYHGVEHGIKISGNDIRLVQLLDKIKDNSLDFSPPGSEISFSLDLDNLQNAIISIKNEGEYIPDDKLELLFQGMISYRPKKSATPHLGIGLYVAHKIAQFHDGQLIIANRRDKQGVEVRLILPLVN
jgi:two-component system, OmpR family, sensor histidine kinase ChvG